MIYAESKIRRGSSDEAGASENVYHLDAFGPARHSFSDGWNLMADWETGLWTDTYSARAGWHHNAKEFDGDTGLVYMYQRWYQPELGIFLTQALFHPSEHAYGFAFNNPIHYGDPNGEWPEYLIDPGFYREFIGDLDDAYTEGRMADAQYGYWSGVAGGLSFGIAEFHDLSDPNQSVSAVAGNVASMLIPGLKGASVGRRAAYHRTWKSAFQRQFGEKAGEQAALSTAFRGLGGSFLPTKFPVAGAVAGLGYGGASAGTAAGG